MSTTKITGEEDRYSHTDLVDFEANVDGAAGGVRRGEADRRSHGTPGSPRRSTADFAAVRALAPYRQGDGFVTYDQLTKADTRKLAASVDTLADELAKVPPVVVTG